MDMDADGYVDWKEFLVYIKCTTTQTSQSWWADEHYFWESAGSCYERWKENLFSCHHVIFQTTE